MAGRKLAIVKQQPANQLQPYCSLLHLTCRSG
jgi:hypothetical protein